MKFRTSINVFKTVLLSTILFAGLAKGQLITSYNWDAQCTDCYGPDIGAVNEAGSTLVSGSLTLNDYIVGDAITSENFNSFSYDGPSLWVDSFTASTVNNLSGFLTDTGALSLLFTFKLGDTFGKVFSEAEIAELTNNYEMLKSEHVQAQETLVLVNRTYQSAMMRVAILNQNTTIAKRDYVAVIGNYDDTQSAYQKLQVAQKELASASTVTDKEDAEAKIAAAEKILLANTEVNSAYNKYLDSKAIAVNAKKDAIALYAPQVSAATLAVAAAEEAETAAAEELSEAKKQAELSDKIYQVDIGDTGFWNISLLDDEYLNDDAILDFGSAARYFAVPEPSSIAVFALAIIGMSSRRFKKKS